MNIFEKICFILVLGLFSSASIFSQEMYTDDLDAGSEELINELFQFNETTLAIYTSSGTDNLQSTGWIMFDDKLQPVIKRQIDSLFISIGFQNTVVEEGRFIIVGKNPYTSSLDILAFSSQGHLDFRHSIPHSEYSFSIRGVTKFQDKYVVSAYGVKEGVEDGLLFWLNQDFSLDTLIVIDKAGWQDIPNQLHTTDDKLILNYDYWEPEENVSWPNIYRGFLIFDGNKEIVNEWFLGPDVNFNTLPIESELVSDSVFITITYSDFSSSRPEVLAVNINNNEILWESNFHYTSSIDRQIRNFVESQDGNILGCGYRGKLPEIERSGWVFKLDASNGDVLWEYMLADTTGLAEFSNSKLMSFLDLSTQDNGDIIVGGSVFNSFLNDDIFYRNDDLFCYKLKEDWCAGMVCDSISFESLQAQDDQIYLDASSEWFYESLGFSATAPGELVRIFVTEDTIINFDSCFVIQLEKSGELISNSEITLCIHGQQILFQEDDCMYRLLSYSDNIKIGDTLEYYLPQNITEYDKTINSGIGEDIRNPYSLIIDEIGEIYSEEEILLKTYKFESFVGVNGECNRLENHIEGITTTRFFLRRGCNEAEENPLNAPSFRCYLSPQINIRIENIECDILESTQDNGFLNSISLSPNPVTNTLSIEGLVSENYIMIYNIYGQPIFQELISGFDVHISTKHWLSGIYFVFIHEGESNRYGYKILKE